MRRLTYFAVLTVLTTAIGLGSAGAADAGLPRQPAASADLTPDAQPIGPGTTLSSFSQMAQGGWLHGNVIEADLTDPRLSVNLLTPPRVGQVQTVSQMANAQHAFAGVNGDFFDVNNTGAADGIEVSDGHLLKGPETEPMAWHQSVGVDTGKIGRVVNAYLTGSVVLPSGSYQLDGLNQEQVPPNGGLGVFTPLWGTAPRAFFNATKVHEVTVVDGVVTGHAAASGAGRIPADGFVLSGTGQDADLLASVPIGAPVSVTYGPRTDPDHKFSALLGVRDVLVRAGQVNATLDDTQLNPETAIGFSQNGKKMWLVVVDGRSTTSPGVTEHQLALMMRERGAYDAVVMDGGGSTEMVARDAGSTKLSVRDVPSEGMERAVGNGVGLFSTPGSGQLTGIHLGTGDAVFTGLHRQLVATGYDETYGPARTTDPRWSGANGHGLFTAGDPGTATVGVSSLGVRAQATIHVLPSLNRISVPQGTVDLVGGRPGTFTVTGYDAAGDAAAVDPADVRLDYDDSKIDVEANSDGTFTVRPSTDDGSAVVTVHVGDRVATVGVAIGLVTVPVTGFDDLKSWTFGATNSAGSIAQVPGRTGNALRMSVDFSHNSLTRAGTARPGTPLTVPGSTHELDMWVNGDGKGEWLALQVTDSTGTAFGFYGDYVTWNGWRRARFPVPAGLSSPITVRSVRVVEAKRLACYTGQLDFDDLTAQVSPAVSPAGRR